MFDRRLHGGQQIGIQVDAVLDTDRGGKAAFVRRTQDGAALGENAGSVFVVQRDIADRVDETFVTFEEADAVVTKLVGAFDDAALPSLVTYRKP